jgi:hypothetical protein
MWALFSALSADKQTLVALALPSRFQSTCLNKAHSVFGGQIATSIAITVLSVLLLYLLPTFITEVRLASWLGGQNF